VGAGPAAVLGHLQLVLDYLWGPVAEAAFTALATTGRRDDNTAGVAHVQIGSRAGERAAVPAALLRSRKIRVTGSGAGSVSKERAVVVPD
jgi:hypothetical protein